MRVYLDHLAMRIIGTLLGTGFVLIGLYALLAGDAGISIVAKERSLSFGIIAIIGGLAAILGSWAEKRLGEVWCAHPNRWQKRKPPLP